MYVLSTSGDLDQAQIHAGQTILVQWLAASFFKTDKEGYHHI